MGTEDTEEGPADDAEDNEETDDARGRNEDTEETDNDVDGVVEPIDELTCAVDAADPTEAGERDEFILG